MRYGYRYVLLVLLVSLLAVSGAPLRAESTTTQNPQGCCVGTRGNVNGQGIIDLSDLSLLVLYLIQIPPPTLPCPDAANVNGQGIIDLSDLSLLVQYLIDIPPPTLPDCPASGPTAEARQAVFSGVDSVENALPGVSADSLAKAIRNYLSGNSSIEAAGIDGADVWALFIDGRMIVIILNRIPTNMPGAEESGTPPQLDSVPPAGFVLPQRIMQSVQEVAPQAPTAITYDVPSTVQARVFSTLGVPCFTVGTTKAKSLLQNGGYVNVTETGTVPNLLTSVHGDGVFYIDAHCGRGQDRARNPGVGCIWTNTLFSEANDSAYASLLDSNELVYMYASDLALGVCQKHWRYAFTGKFVARYMTFAKNSFVLINACTSDNPTIKDGFKTAGASVYAGWTLPVTDPYANKAGEFLLDRMLGTNSSTLTPVESPQQRPFGYTAVWQDMKNRGFDTDSSDGSKLILSKLKDNFELLAPSIRFAFVINYTDTLNITGFFGSDPGAKGHVKINGVEQTIFKWDTTLLWVSIPRSGPGAAGPITVSIDPLTGPTSAIKRLSNTIKLSEWKGKITYTDQDAGTLLGKIEINAHIKADVHKFRDFPHTPPAANQFIVFGGTKDTDGNATASGSFNYPIPNSDPLDVETWIWSGSSHIPFATQVNPNGIMLQGSIYASTKTMSMLTFASANQGMTELDTTIQSGVLSVSDLVFTPPQELYDTIPYKLKYTFDSGWNIVAGQKSKTLCCSKNPDNVNSDPDVVHKIVWPKIDNLFPPDTTAAQ